VVGNREEAVGLARYSEEERERDMGCSVLYCSEPAMAQSMSEYEDGDWDDCGSPPGAADDDANILANTPLLPFNVLPLVVDEPAATVVVVVVVKAAATGCCCTSPAG